MEQKFEEKILEILVGLQSDVSGLKEDVKGLKSDVSGLKNDVKELQIDMREVKSELSELSKREEQHYNMLQQSIGDAFESVKILDQKKLDKAALKKII